ncbi:MAG TPA: PD-(D/E)XK nuclease family protein [Clostridia bacterium]|nr:PD-(D/E)XK nuclease family protein [Clostridia bacterium]
MKIAITQDELLAAAERGVLILTGNTRASRNLRVAYDNRHRRTSEVWKSPVIVPWTGWLHQLWNGHVLSAAEGAPALLSEAQELLLWEQAIRACERDVKGTQLRATAKAAKQAWTYVHAFDVPRERALFATSVDTSAFWQWMAEFAKRCHRNRWQDTARLPDALCEAAKNGELQVPREILLVGFDRLTPQQERVLAACVGNGARWQFNDLVAGTKLAVCTSVSDGDEEFSAAAMWARESVEAGVQSIGIVVPDLTDRRARVERILLETLQPAALAITHGQSRPVFDISLGDSLAKTPLVSTALAILRFALGALPVEEVSRLLRSQFLRGGLSECHSRALLDARLRAEGRFEVSLDGVLRCATNAIGKPSDSPALRAQLSALKAAANSLSPSLAPSQFSRHVPGLLKAAGWPGDRSLSSAEHQAMRAWVELLSEFASLDVVERQLSRVDLLQRLQVMVADQIFQPENRGAPIQVMGTLEAAGSTFDRLWVTGLDEGAWPPASHPNPFLPLAVQRKLSIPGASADEQLQFAARATERFRTSAEHVVFSHAMTDGENELRASALLSSFPAVDIGTLLTRRGETWIGAMAASSAELDEMSDTQGPPLQDGSIRGGTAIFATQAACPFRAFAQFRLAAEPLESPQPGLDPRARGKVLHIALEKVWKRLRDREALLQLSAEGEQALLAECVTEALRESHVGTGSEWERNVAELEHQRVCAIIAKLLAVERLRPEFKVEQTEWKNTVTVGGVTFDVKIDRIDHVKGFGRVLLDYKTGSAGPSSWIGERLDEPQLPIYATHMEGEPAAVAFVEVQSKKVRFKGIAAQDGVLPSVNVAYKSKASGETYSLEALLVQWKQALEGLGQEFRDGRAVVAPKKGEQTCRNCQLDALCRVSQLEGQDAGQPGDDDDGQ